MINATITAREGQINIPDEETPLLPNPTLNSGTTAQDEASATTRQPTTREDDDTPLPLRQIFLLCYARLVEPIAFFSIFPFVNQMIQRNGSLPEEDVGFYSGLIESLFSLTQMFVMLFWGRMADQIGRKPILVVSLFFVAIATSIFGFSRTIWQMILFRCLAGAFSGSVVTIRTMITELSTSKTQARAFSFFAFSQNLGIFLGPLLGGALADPAAQYPGSFFAHIRFFKLFPYALPTIITGLIGLTAAITSSLFIKETKVNPPKKSPSSSNPNSSPPKPLSTIQLLREPGVIKILYLTTHLMLLGFAFTAILPLFLFTTVAKGGFGFTPIQISLAMGLTGFSQAIWLLIVFPPLQKRIGTGGVLRLCSVVHPFLFIAAPLLNLLLRYAGDSHTTPAMILFWIIGPFVLIVGVGVSMAFTAVQLALNDIAPNMESLGTLNALALTVTTGNRAFSPWAMTSIFAVGARTQVLGGHLVWGILTVLAVGYAVAVWRWLPEKAEGKLMVRGRQGKRKKGGGNGCVVEREEG